MAQKVQFTETVVRDANQSLMATRMAFSDFEEILPTMDKAGYYSVECWGGATFDSCLRYLNEDPWERLRKIRKAMPNTRLQMLLRGQNLLGYKHYHDDVVEKFVQLSIKNGIDVLRIFDALNDFRNIKTALEATKKYGTKRTVASGCISYTQSPVHTPKKYAEMCKELQKMGFDTICLKDMAGTMSPKEAEELFKGIKDAGVTLPLILAFLLAALALAALLWWLRGWSVIRKGSQSLAAGDLNYTTDTTGLPWDLQKHGADLNAISDGMQKAVEERMRSDRFRTELITNVSHDLKTPLTSIINYVDLLKKLNLQNPTAQQYIDVLDRKSQRLKTLTEDLVEASKASAGVLAVDRQRLETTQLVRQALGEYEDKLRDAQLRVIQRYPKEGAWILADGRHLWRILDNLLSNCAKYAMPGTRLYVDVIRRDGNVEISLKNISADPLNIPSEDLLRRFVRGDDSRSTPGSGLGLSIAQSLAHLQGAEFSIDIDGDLFKALVRFPESAGEN